ncbi:hypothetical protein B7463_g9126, partial [Scytalidium lignicola]
MELFRSYVVLLAILGTTFANKLTSVVVLGNGAVQGSLRDENGILAFKGIPFAEPPVGNLRWRPPYPAPPWKGIRNGTEFGSTCVSALEGAPVTSPQNEDCLTVNVWTGASQQDEKLPVMVWIYGGGFQYGSSADPMYSGEILAQENVIVVSFNYRLGVLGFLALAELDLEGPPSGNFGLQDQVAALKWVQDNISAFGGDPNNVTVFGESAGSHAIGILMTSPLAQGLFHKAILQSGAFWDTNHGSLSEFSETRQKGLTLLKNLNVSSLRELRALPAQVVNSVALWDTNFDPAASAFSPNIDGYVVPINPAQAFDEGRQMKIPILIGWNEEEQYPFRPFALPHRSAVEFRYAAESYFVAAARKFFSLYPAVTDDQANISADALIGDLVIRQQTWEAADSHSQIRTLPVYVYYFTYVSAYSPIASHGADLVFTLGSLVPNQIVPSAPPPDGQDKLFSKKLRAYWTNFAKHGDPNDERAGLPFWPTYVGQEHILELGNNISTIEYPLHRFRFLKSLRTNGVLPRRWKQFNDSVATE